MTTKIKAGVIGDGVVGTTQIAANAVTSAKLAQNSVLTKHIDDNQIGIDQLNVSDGSSGQVLTTNGSGTLSFSTISGGVDGISTSADATAITIDSSENVGIGTGSPAKKLDVSGAIRTSTGILFGSNTAAANTLDYYAEGTWTPALDNVTTSSSTMYGIYTRIGRICFIHAKISATVTSLPGQTFQISGLPFAATNTSDTGQRAIIAIGGDASNLGAAVNGRAHFITNGSTLQAIYMNSGTKADFTYNIMDHTTFELHIHGHYTV